jgi:hypothetical protein
MPSRVAVTIKELHDDTTALVHYAAALGGPVSITDRGREIAVLANRSLLRPKNRIRVVLPEYEALMTIPPGNYTEAALDEMRGSR